MSYKFMFHLFLFEKNLILENIIFLIFFSIDFL
nr:MAG TPA: hypothetical protein [Caudoviricetes sp.]